MLLHHAAINPISFPGFVAAAPWPRGQAELNGGAVPWREGSGFDTIGWGPDTDVRGSYSVELTTGGQDFIVHGWVDGDGDGLRAHVTATRAQDATLQTQAGIY